MISKSHYFLNKVSNPKIIFLLNWHHQSYNRPSKVIPAPEEAGPSSPAPVIIAAVTETEHNGGESVALRTVTGDEEIIQGSGHTVNTQLQQPDTNVLFATKSSWHPTTQSQEEVTTSRSQTSRWVLTTDCIMDTIIKRMTNFSLRNVFYGYV